MMEVLGIPIYFNIQSIIYYILAVVQLSHRQMQTYQSSVSQNQKNILIETFGRGSMPHYQETRFSERSTDNQRDQNQYIYHETIGQRKREYENYSKKRGNSKPKQKSNTVQLAYIDQINTKISGLIKSISVSCQKKQMKSNYEEKENQSKKIINFEGKRGDHIKTEKKKQINFGYIQSNTKSIFFRDLETEQKKGKRKQQESQFDQDQYDSMSQRIKKISGKIEEYQKRIGKTQNKNVENMRKNSSKAENNFKMEKNDHETRELRQIKDFDNERKKQKKHTNNLENKIFDRIQALNKNDFGKANVSKKQQIINEMKEASFKKTGYFNSKFKQIQLQKADNRIKDRGTKNESKGKSQINSILKIQEIKRPSKSNLVPAKSNIIHSNFNQNIAYKTTFMKTLIAQINFDQDLRQTKHMFGGIECLSSDDDQKWLKLQSELRKQGFSMSLQQVRATFMPRDDEIDPFMSVSHSHQQLVHGIIYAYQSAERHWNENMYHGWTVWELKQSKFTGELLDRTKKGFVTLQDLTFYVNTQIDGSYRNRDLLLIFLRLSGKTREQTDHCIKLRDIMNNLLSI